MPRSVRTSAGLFVAIVAGGGIAASIALGNVTYFFVCLVGALISVTLARWFLRKTGLGHYYEEVEHEVSSRRARDREHPDAR